MPSFVELQGKIVRKKKRYDWLVMAIRKNDNERSMNVYISRNTSPVLEGLGRSLRAFSDSDELGDLLYPEAIVRLKGFIRRARPIHSVANVIADEEEEEEEEEQFLVDEVTLVRCAPNPAPIRRVLESISREEGRFSPSVLLMESEQTDEHHHIMSAQEEAARILSLKKQRQQRLEIARILRKLQGQETLERDPRYRLPRVRKYDLDLLDRIEGIGKSQDASWALETPRPTGTIYQGGDAVSLPLNLPQVDPSSTDTTGLDVSHQLISKNGSRTRVDYLTTKKHPQIQFMSSHVEAVLKERHMGVKTHILDVGGGRGDLATALALKFPECLVTMVDLYEPSLEAARAFASRLGLSNRIYFVQADFRAFTKDPEKFYKSLQAGKGSNSAGPPIPPPTINMVVALHACGDLSDLAMAFAQELSCPFVVCPCCYTKRYITDDFSPAWWRHLLGQKKDVDSESEVDQHSNNDSDDRPRAAKDLGRLAEFNERPEMSKRAMMIINSMRLHSVPDDSYCVTLEEYDSTSSGKNLVLVGLTSC